MYVDKKKKNVAIGLLSLNLIVTILFSQHVLITKKFSDISKAYDSSISWIAKNNKENFYSVHETSQGDIPQDVAFLNKVLLLQSNYGLFMKNSPAEIYNFRGNKEYIDIQPGFVLSKTSLNKTYLQETKEGKIFLYRNTLAKPLATINNKEQVVKFSVNKINVSGFSSNSAKLTILESNYPGWKVFLDGEKKNLFNGRFLEVETKPGRHNYEFVYSSNSFTAGFLVSLLSMSLWGFYTIKKEDVKSVLKA
jgi:hypothetical protein